MKERSWKDYALIACKGVAMGAADVVPGVSGGTIAFITGIYEELLSSISQVGMGTLRLIGSGKLLEAWKSINGSFLSTLLLGILVSVATLVHLISFLLENEAILLWSFFAGLIIASIGIVAKRINHWKPPVFIGMILASIFAFYISTMHGGFNSEGWLYLFFSGCVAICAMILPGISGAFILLLLGAYETIINAIKSFEVSTLFVFALGCVVGLLSFSKLLTWMFRKFHDLTVAVLTGFLIGSLAKIWPWKETIQTRINSKGEEVPFIQTNVFPDRYTELYDLPHDLGMAIFLASLGFSIVFLLERMSKPTR